MTIKYKITPKWGDIETVFKFRKQEDDDYREIEHISSFFRGGYLIATLSDDDPYYPHQSEDEWKESIYDGEYLNFHSSVETKDSYNDGNGVGYDLEHDQWNYQDVFDDDEWEEMCDDDLEEGLEEKGFTSNHERLRIWGGIEIERIDG